MLLTGAQSKHCLRQVRAAMQEMRQGDVDRGVCGEQYRKLVIFHISSFPGHTGQSFAPKRTNCNQTTLTIPGDWPTYWFADQQWLPEYKLVCMRDLIYAILPKSEKFDPSKMQKNESTLLLRRD